MANTSNKSSTKKSTTKKKTAVRKKTAASKAPVSFKLEQDRDNFTSTKFTSQSLYWIIFGIVVIAFALWVTKLQSDIQDIYDRIDSAQNTVQTPVKKPKNSRH